MKKISLLLASLCALFLVACSNQKQADGKLNIVTTFYPVYEFEFPICLFLIVTSH